MRKTLKLKLFVLGFSWAFATQAVAQDSDVELAKQLANPVANLISVPFQFNYDRNVGADDGDMITVNFQPVIPFKLNDDWLAVSRTIVPLISQDDIPMNSLGETGLGDITQSFFVTPTTVNSLGDDGNWLWGVGGAFLLPTASDDALGTEKWGAGPSGLAMVQSGHWSYGGLATHVWSFAGNDDRADVNQTLLQPFVTYTTDSAINISPNADITYNWDTEEWAIPVSFMVSKVFRVGEQPVSVAMGARYWFEGPDSGPDGLGARLNISLLFPED